MGNTQYVHVYPTKEQQQKLVQFRMDSLQKAGQDHLQRIQDNEKQINDEAQATMDSTMVPEIPDKPTRLVPPLFS